MTLQKVIWHSQHFAACETRAENPPCLDFGPKNCEQTHGCCFQPLRLQSLYAAWGADTCGIAVGNFLF